MDARRETVLSIANVTKDFSGTRALEDVDFDLFAGEVHCLVGENGAGKSTLIKILSGAEKPDKGQITVFGHAYSAMKPRDALRMGIATIYQDVDLVTSLSVADNIFLGSELYTRLGVVDSRRQEQIAQEVMSRVNIHINPRELVERLSPAQRQTLQIAKALHRQARILIMDEPTSSLGKEETTALIHTIKSLTQRGIGIIYISHFLEEVFEIGDRITVLKDGRKIRTVYRNDCTIDDIVRDMVGRDASHFYRKEQVSIGDVVIRVKHISRGTAVRDVSFDVRAGEIFGIGGIVGSGRTELVNLLYGSDRKDSGELWLNGTQVTLRSPKHAIREGICMISEDRKQDGLFLGRPVRENIAVIDNEGRGLFLRLRKEARKVTSISERLDIHFSGINQEVGFLSGGNQQKTVLARWLLNPASVYIFDEPTKGVDIGAKAAIYQFMVDLAHQGKAIIMISSSMPELISLSDRIGIMRNGQMIDILASDQVTEESLLMRFLGLNGSPAEQRNSGLMSSLASQ